MTKFQPGEKARIIYMPEKGEHLFNEIVTVLNTSGIGLEEGDVLVKSEIGTVLFLNESQLEKVTN